MHYRTPIILETLPAGGETVHLLDVCLAACGNHLVRRLGLVLSLIQNPVSQGELSAVAADLEGPSSLLSFLNTGKMAVLERKLRESKHGCVVVERVLRCRGLLLSR